MKDKSKKFWEQVQKDKDEVKTWAKWKQQIVITSETCATGRFIKRSKNG